MKHSGELFVVGLGGSHFEETLCTIRIMFTNAYRWLFPNPASHWSLSQSPPPFPAYWVSSTTSIHPGMALKTYLSCPKEILHMGSSAYVFFYPYTYQCSLKPHVSLDDGPLASRGITKKKNVEAIDIFATSHFTPFDRKISLSRKTYMWIIFARMLVDLIIFYWFSKSIPYWWRWYRNVLPSLKFHLMVRWKLKSFLIYIKYVTLHLLPRPRRFARIASYIEKSRTSDCPGVAVGEVAAADATFCSTQSLLLRAQECKQILMRNLQSEVHLHFFDVVYCA